MGYRYCAECSYNPKLAVFGSRCVRHYLWRKARYYGISKYGWWIHHVPKFSRQLLGRYIAIKEGNDPGNVKPLIQQFLMGDHSMHRMRQSAAYSGVRKLVKIIEAVDNLARRDRGTS